MRSDTTQPPATEHQTRPAQRQPLTERRQKRISNSRAAQAAHLEAKLAACETPMDRLAVTVDALRTRLRQRLNSAERALERTRKARDQRGIETATARLNIVRGEVDQLCERVIEYVSKLADSVDTARR